MRLSENENLLRNFVTGRLPEVESQLILDELEHDDEALAKVDELWAALSAYEQVWTTTELEADTALSLERRLFRGLHRSNLSGTALRLGTSGLGAVLLALIRPLVNLGRRKVQEEK